MTVNISIPDEIKDKMDEEAEKIGISFSAFVKVLFMQYLEKKEGI